MNRQKRNDTLWIVIVATLILAFSAIPSWVGYQAQTDEISYKGIFFDPYDYAVHMSMLRAGMQGEWAYQFRFTTEPHQAAYTRLFYLALGQTNRILRIDPTLLFEIARWLFGYIALFALYALTKRIFRESIWQRVAFLLAVFGSGLGWIQFIVGWVPGQVTPIDFWLIDAYTFFGIALFPHFSFVTASLCLVLVMYLDYLEKSNWKYILGICCLAIVTQFVNPIAFILVDLALVVITSTIWRQQKKVDWPQFTSLGAIAIAQVPLLLYNFNLLTNDPLWIQFTRQNQTLSPPPVYYLWGFGLLWIFALAGSIFALRRRDPALSGLVVWVIAAFVLAYIPFAIQRRFLHGVTIPLGILAALGLAEIIQKASQSFKVLEKRKTILATLVVFFTSMSSLYLIVGYIFVLRGHSPELFYPASLNPALTWLEENAAPNDFVLSAAPSGLLIAQKTDLRVYFGHLMETLNHDSKLQLVENYFQGKAEPGWVKTASVQWVLYGPYEQNLSEDNNFSDGTLQPVYHIPGVTIYRVKR